MRWKYLAIVIFKSGNVKDVEGSVFAMNDRFSASLIVRSEIARQHKDVDRIIIVELTH